MERDWGNYPWWANNSGGSGFLCPGSGQNDITGKSGINNPKACRDGECGWPMGFHCQAKVLKDCCRAVKCHVGDQWKESDLKRTDFSIATRTWWPLTPHLIEDESYDAPRHSFQLHMEIRLQRETLRIGIAGNNSAWAGGICTYI